MSLENVCKYIFYKNKYLIVWKSEHFKRVFLYKNLSKFEKLTKHRYKNKNIKKYNKCYILINVLNPRIELEFVVS